MNESALADFLLRHHGANPEDAALAAGLIIDEHERTNRPIADLVSASKSGFPSFYRRPEPTQAAEPTSRESMTQRVARLGDTGALDPEVLAVMKRIRERGI